MRSCAIVGIFRDIFRTIPTTIWENLFVKISSIFYLQFITFFDQAVYEKTMLNCLYENGEICSDSEAI